MNASAIFSGPHSQEIEHELRSFEATTDSWTKSHKRFRGTTPISMFSTSRCMYRSIASTLYRFPYHFCGIHATLHAIVFVSICSNLGISDSPRCQEEVPTELDAKHGSDIALSLSSFLGILTDVLRVMNLHVQPPRRSAEDELTGTYRCQVVNPSCQRYRNNPASLGWLAGLTASF